MRHPITRLLALVLALALVATACTGDDGDDDAGTTTEAEEAPATGDDEEPGEASDPLVIPTELGDVRGVASDTDGVRAFLALPYAAPPTGDDAWRAPQPREPYGDTFDADTPGRSCPQGSGDSTSAVTEIPESTDDCLTLSVWAPDDAEDLPVMVWFHGGGLRSGSAHQPLYIGDDLASRGVVVVGVNYRLGAQGFLATDELAEESDDGSFGNYGLADQIAGLEWVQDNVEGFGGDPDEVTIFGESAGGFAVCGHLASPASTGLFQRAIVQSGGGCGRLLDGDDARSAGADLLDEVGCEDVACLRELDIDTVMAADFSPSLVADGVLLDEPAATLAAAGELDDVPVLIGSNETEAWLFTLGADEPGDDELVALVGEVTDDPEALLAQYPADEYDTNLERYRTLLTEVRFSCPTVAYAEAARGDTFVYHYVFDSPSDPFGLGPTHGAELATLFAHPEGISGLDPIGADTDPANLAASETIQAAWIAFATDGDPGEGWEPWADAGRHTVLDEDATLSDTFRGDRCPTVLELSTLAR